MHSILALRKGFLCIIPGTFHTLYICLDCFCHTINPHQPVTRRYVLHHPAALYADVKIPVTMQDPKPDALIRNTLWLRDELFHGAGSLSEPPACRLKKRSGDGSSTSDSDGHLYVNHLPVSQHARSATDGTVSWRAHFVAGRYVGSNTASLAASKADTYEMSDQASMDSNTLRLDQLARQIASLRRQVGKQGENLKCTGCS